MKSKIKFLKFILGTRGQVLTFEIIMVFNPIQALKDRES